MHRKICLLTDWVRSLWLSCIDSRRKFHNDLSLSYLIMFLQSQLSELKTYIPQYDITNTKISGVSVWRHIDHSLIVIRDVMQQVIDSHPNDYKRSFNIGRIVVLWTGFIPRGRAKAPDFTIPKTEINTDTILWHLKEVEELLPVFESLTDNHKYLNHPFFGKLTLAQSKRNLLIHTNHHLKIIRDIVK